MRVPSAILALSIVMPAAAATPTVDTSTPPILDKQRFEAASALTRRCPPTVNDYLARRVGDYRGKRLMPKKLTELPPGTTYMAVLREIGGCNAPLTMIEYRNPPRR